MINIQMKRTLLLFSTLQKKEPFLFLIQKSKKSDFEKILITIVTAKHKLIIDLTLEAQRGHFCLFLKFE